MPTRVTPLGLSRLLLTEHEPQIALLALTRLRWLAVVGQVAAVVVAVAGLKLRLPIVPIAGVVVLTMATNAVVVVEMRWHRPRRWLVQFLLLLDVGSLTALLYFTGGAANPFAVLYLVHVAMAVTVLGSAWTWVVVGMAAACYGALFVWHVPLVRGAAEIPPWVLGVGHWFALALVAVLIAVFIGRVEDSLREREQELVDMRERATKNEQLAALTTLAAGAAHELNTPLGTIAVVAKELEVSADSPGDAEAVREDARLIRREVDRCREIINRLRLDVAFDPEGSNGGEDLPQRRLTPVTSLVKRLREGLRSQEAARLRVLIGSDVQSVAAPARALEQALLVLLRNAFDASPTDAGVTLSIQRREGRMRIEVEDRGAGMSDELLRRAGEPFYTTKEPGRGMGLGLFLVRLVAERCGAQFSLSSKLGEGTRCVLELGPQPGAPPAGEGKETNRKTGEQGQARVSA
jgi:two-component system sensor histidine kinase RegB